MEEEFIAQFHAISGETVHESRHQFFKILSQHSNSLKADQHRLQAICRQLQPRTALEKVFHIDFLIYFKRASELCQQVFEANEIAIYKLLNAKWFYEELFRNISIPDFVRLLPKLSYSMRKKILKKLPLDEHKYDELFDQVRQRYGMFLTTTIIQYCSVSKIRRIIADCIPDLTLRQLRTIFDKEPELIDFYIAVRAKFNSRLFWDDAQIFVYIAQKNPEYFFKLYKKYKFLVSIGGRTTKRLVKANRGEILAKPEAFVNMLQDTRLIRQLGLDFKPFFKAIFPRNLPESTQGRFLCILQGYAKNDRFNLFKTTFNELSTQQFGNDPDMITQDVLELNMDPYEREYLARIYLRKHVNNEYYLGFFTMKNCLDIIKVRLYLTSSSKIHKRYVKIMAQCCVRNEHLASLIDLTIFINIRFKNDKPRIMQAYLNSVIFGSSKKFRATFSKQLWEQLYSLIVADMKYYNDERKYYVYYYIEYLVRSGEQIDHIVVQHYESNIENCIDYVENLDNRRVDYEILKSLARVSQIYQNNEKLNKKLNIMYAIQRNNHLYKQKYIIKIYEYHEFINTIKIILREQPEMFVDFHFLETIQYLITVRDEKWRQHTDFTLIQKRFFDNFETLGNRDILLALLRHQPNTVQEYFNDIFKDFPSNWKTMSKFAKKCWRFIRNLSHLDLAEKLISLCIEKLSEPTFLYKTKLIGPLSYLMRDEDFSKLAQHYQRIKDEVDEFSEAGQQLYALKLEFDHHLKNIQSSRKVFHLRKQSDETD